VFLRAADLLSTEKRNTVLASTMIGQAKTIYQAEIDAAAEAADFFRFGVQCVARGMRRSPLFSPLVVPRGGVKQGVCKRRRARVCGGVRGGSSLLWASSKCPTPSPPPLKRSCGVRSFANDIYRQQPEHHSNHVWNRLNYRALEVLAAVPASVLVCSGV
jgi:hypothetical protein